jgi:hypothetical protein
MLGEAGNGKTHTLAEIRTEFERAGGVVLFMEGRHFTSEGEAWSQILRFVGFEGTTQDFLLAFPPWPPIPA